MSRRCCILALTVFSAATAARADSVVLDNAYVRVSRNAAHPARGHGRGNARGARGVAAEFPGGAAWVALM